LGATARRGTAAASSCARLNPAGSPGDQALSNNALSESFDFGLGPISNAWNVDQSVSGQVTLRGSSAMMEWAVGPDAGHGYGTYTVTAKVDGNQPGAAIVLWPGDNQWPGQEIDMMETAVDGSGRHYGTVHWNAGGSDGYNYTVYDGITGGVFHDYQMVWEPGKITFSVDGKQMGVITDHVPVDYDHGGMNDTIGFLNNNPNTSITVSHVDFTPLGSPTAVTQLTMLAATPASAADPAPAAVPEPEAQPEPEAASHADAPIDWNAIAAQVQANFEATGFWTMPSSFGPQATVHSGESDMVDWNALAAQVQANFDATGFWLI
jgi:hypothetical protein